MEGLSRSEPSDSRGFTQDTGLLVNDGSKQTSTYQLLSTSTESGKHFYRYVVWCALLASLNSVLLGYDIGIMSGAVLFIKEDLKIHELQEEVLVGSLNLISLVGGVLAGRLSDSIGRKKTMAIASVIFFLGAGVMGLAPNFGILLGGRIVAGIGVGFGLMIAPVYTAELAPAASRGALVSFPEIFINVGILLGYIVSYLLSGLSAGLSWRLMLGAGCIPAIVLAVGVLFMPESPRWLVMQSRIPEAEVVLLKTSRSKQEADERLADIMAAAKLNQQAGKSQGEGVWNELLWPVPSVRRMVIVALGIQFFQQASGIDALVYYSPAVFNQAGITSKAGVLGTTVAVGFTKTAFILVATSLLDKVGRRPLLLASSVGMAASLATVALGFVFYDSSMDPSKHRHLPVQSTAKSPGGSSDVALALIITAICVFMASFSVGFGPINMVLNSEVFPLRLRAQAVSLGLLVNRLVSGTIGLTFLSISEALSLAGTFFLFAGIAAASVVFIYFLVPETKGKSLEEIAGMFEREGMLAGSPELVELSSSAAVAGGQSFKYEDVGSAPHEHLEVEGSHEEGGGRLGQQGMYDEESHKKLLAKVKLIAAKQGNV
ncbi:probable polyol transporter 6 [Selaginella moellendorffii]|uniref:probable polyol transporter 6 n=1 Tax=Selaginella moellendorffii TaxID=88036 RepID=UPI000D1C4A8C|nr:probable polyol transporter 6 [Selaginella moellendorffii]XP_024539345.1 probable polyol transporter 6 [Selaginella moellendorffii]|eukprot:XP_024539344.1 probable polyol transporter 6 [Selaginella moellendorffii]